MATKAKSVKRSIKYKGAYQATAHVIITDDFKTAAEKIRREVPKLDYVDDIDGDVACCMHSKKRSCEVWILLAPDASAGLVAHECVHAANFLLGDLGVRVTQRNDESHAYMVQWLVDEIVKLLPRARKHR